MIALGPEDLTPEDIQVILPDGAVIVGIGARSIRSYQVRPKFLVMSVDYMLGDKSRRLSFGAITVAVHREAILAARYQRQRARFEVMEEIRDAI